jgi:penicillin-binding protein 1B
MPSFYRGKNSRKEKESKSRREGRREGKRTLREKLRLIARAGKVLLVVAMVGAIALAVYIHRIDRMIEEKFDRPQKWNLPSRIYSDAEHLYPGVNIRHRSIVTKLDSLGYRDTGESIEGPGDYAMGKGRLDIYLHDFSYPYEDFKGFPVRLLIKDGRIASMTNLDTKEGVELVKLEPEEIATILDVKMEDRTFVTIDEVPPQLIEAIILIEDERFFEHSGVDPWGIMRAAVVNISKMRIAQGGSTLTQQLVKNFFLHPKRSILRKMNEALIAIQIERRHTKKEILQAYLNEIYLGQRGSASISGVGEAAKVYFAKDVGQLTLGECAMLAGMIRSPNAYNPLTKPEKAAERRNLVLKKMLEEGMIDRGAFDVATSEKVITPKISKRAVRAPYFIDFVKQQLADLYPQEVLESEGLRIFTTLDMTYQRFAEKAVSEGLASLEKTYAKRLPKDHEGKLQGALIAMQPSNGFVRALVGGRSYGDSQFNRATQAKRQPGSTFKPFVYLTAFDPDRAERLFTPSSIIDDTPFSVRSGGKTWRPNNYDKKSHGLVSLRKALYMSYNIATAKVAIFAGLENVLKTARDAGIGSEMIAVPSMSLGAFEVTPLEMAAAYTIFPNGGLKAKPLSIINVVTKEGEVLDRKRLEIKRAFDAGPVYLTTSVLKDVLDRGTGRRARSMGFTGVAGGKTGTTSNYRDAWFAGFTANLLGLVWVGYDDNAKMKMSGSSAALPLWTDFMKKAQPSATQKFAGPPNVILVKINPPTGLLVNRSCPEHAYEPFIEGTEPDISCDEFIPPTDEEVQF